MDVKTLAELREADERTLAFSPLGLGGRLRPEDAAEFQQHMVARHELVGEVAEGTRQSFDQLCEICAYGVLCYPIYTMVADHGLLVFEQALRDRFLSFHQGHLTVVHPGTGDVRQVAADKYDQVHAFARNPRGYQLQVGAGPETMEFNSMLGGLIRWARKLGFLRGQRNRAVEQAITQLRNHVAHPSGYHLTTPADAATTISDLAEIINHLWGATTPGGRLYPASVERGIVALMWDKAAGLAMSGTIAPDAGHAGQEFSPGGPDPAGLTWMLVRGVVSDWDLLHYDTRYETGRYPADWLWGPGTAQDAQAWLGQHHPAGDQVDILDRVFLLRYHDGFLYLPQNPDIAAAANDGGKAGTWYLIRADGPADAFSHQRQALAGGFGCADTGQCSQCPAETVGGGDWDQVMDTLSAHGITPRPRDVPDARVPHQMRGMRRIRILDGCWDIPDLEG